MQKKILFDNQEFQVSPDNLPCLIHGNHGSGASLFSVSLVADLVAQGKKILMISGYEMAREELLNQMENKDEFKIFEREDIVAELASKQVLCAKKEDSELFLTACEYLPDKEERMVFVKNFELFEEPFLKRVLDNTNLLLVGDLNEFTSPEMIISKKWHTKIYFSQAKTDSGFPLLLLTKYQGYLMSDTKKGVVSLQV